MTEHVLFAAGVLVLVIALAVTALGAWWWGRAVSAVAAARVNLVEQRERENPAPEEPEVGPAGLYAQPNIPSASAMAEAARWARLERGETPDDLAGVPHDELLHSGAYVRETDE